jgi:uncharacterized protein (DUF1330 family)
MSKAYWVAHVTVTNPNTYTDHMAAPVTFKKHGGRLLARGELVTILLALLLLKDWTKWL